MFIVCIIFSLYYISEMPKKVVTLLLLSLILDIIMVTGR